MVSPPDFQIFKMCVSGSITVTIVYCILLNIKSGTAYNGCLTLSSENGCGVVMA